MLLVHQLYYHIYTTRQLVKERMTHYLYSAQPYLRRILEELRDQVMH